jgi:hypothetical protein
MRIYVLDILTNIGFISCLSHVYLFPYQLVIFSVNIHWRFLTLQIRESP